MTLVQCLHLLQVFRVMKMTMTRTSVRMIKTIECLLFTQGIGLVLRDPLIANKKVVVEIRGSEDAGWLDGDLELKRGYVSSAFASLSEITALFHPLDSPGGPPVHVPTVYLQPVQPEEVEDHALVLRGSHKGKHVVLRESAGHGVWKVSQFQDPDAFSIDEELLVKLYHV